MFVHIQESFQIMINCTLVAFIHDSDFYLKIILYSTGNANLFNMYLLSIYSMPCIFQAK